MLGGIIGNTFNKLNQFPERLRGKREIPEAELKALRLEILLAVDEFCRANNLRYSLAYGTLIGAVRHKGFIPWDDDLDICMPVPDLVELKKSFSSDKFRLVDVDNCPGYPFFFPRICNDLTYDRVGMIVKNYGVNIDIYPIAGLPSGKEEIDKYLAVNGRVNAGINKKVLNNGRLQRMLPLKSAIAYAEELKKFRDELYFASPYGESGTYVCLGGEFEPIHVFDHDIFAEIVELDFEGHKVMAVKEYDAVLRQIFGDYMQLPPEDQRIPYHGGNVYWK